MKLVVVGLLCAASGARAQQLSWREIRIPMSEAGPAGFEALVAYPDDGERHPLALLSHGSPRLPDERLGMTARQMLPQAMAFARRGWTAAVVLRRGYGTSGGGWAEAFGSCEHPDYVKASRAQTADLNAAIRFLSTLPEVDGGRILLVGHSAGGLATIALTANPPPGVRAAISFAGGRGSRSADVVCHEEALVAAFKAFGTTSRTPMLWVYSDNDHFFGPALAQRLRTAFGSAGGKVQFVRAPAFGKDGHDLFLRGIDQWTADVDEFLAKQGLALRQALLPAPPRVSLQPPQWLSAPSRVGFSEFLAAPPHKAFAASPDGRWGWRSGRRTMEEARAGALGACRETACRVVAQDDVLVP